MEKTKLVLAFFAGLSMGSFAWAQADHRLEIPKDPGRWRMLEVVQPFSESDFRLANDMGISGDFVVAVRVDRSMGNRIVLTREVVSYETFQLETGIAESPDNGKFDATTLDESGAGGIPIPPPPSDFGWQPGDTVIYYRFGTVGGRSARRTVVYQYAGAGGREEWIRTHNIIHYCDIVDCTKPPQPKVGL